MTNKKKNLISALSVLACSALVIGFNGLGKYSADASTDYSSVFFVRSASLRESDGGYAEAVNYKTVIKQDAFVDMLAKKDGENVVKSENGNWEVMEGVKTYTVFAQTSTLDGAELTLENGTAVETTMHWFPVEYGGTKYLECIAYVDQIPATNFTSDISVISVIDVPEGYGEDIYSATVAPQSLSDIAQLAIDQGVTTEDKVSSYLSCTVNYWVDGSVKATEMKKVGESLSQPTNIYVKGCAIEGWMNQAGTATWDFEDNVVTGPTNLYAKLTSKAVALSNGSATYVLSSAEDAVIDDAEDAIAAEMEKGNKVVEVRSNSGWSNWPSALIDGLDTKAEREAAVKAFKNDTSNGIVRVRMYMPEGMKWNEVIIRCGDNTKYDGKTIAVIQEGQWVDYYINIHDMMNALVSGTTLSCDSDIVLRTDSGASFDATLGNVVYVSEVSYHKSMLNVNEATASYGKLSAIGSASEALVKDATTQAALTAELAKTGYVVQYHKPTDASPEWPRFAISQWNNNAVEYAKAYKNDGNTYRFMTVRAYMPSGMKWGKAQFQANNVIIESSSAVKEGEWVDYTFDLAKIYDAVNASGSVWNTYFITHSAASTDATLGLVTYISKVEFYTQYSYGKRITSASDAAMKDAATQAALASEIASRGHVEEFSATSMWISVSDKVIYPSDNSIAMAKKYVEDGYSNRYMVIRMYMPEGMVWSSVGIGKSSGWSAAASETPVAGQWMEYRIDLHEFYTSRATSTESLWLLIKSYSGVVDYVDGTTVYAYISGIWFEDGARA